MTTTKDYIYYVKTLKEIIIEDIAKLEENDIWAMN